MSEKQNYKERERAGDRKKMRKRKIYFPVTPQTATSEPGLPHERQGSKLLGSHTVPSLAREQDGGMEEEMRLERVH